MALVDHKSGAAAVDPDDHNAVVDAVITLQAGGGSLPAGGTTGQVLTKASNAEGDADWETGSGGSGAGSFELVKIAIAFNTPGLLAGITMYTPAAGDVLPCVFGAGISPAFVSVPAAWANGGITSAVLHLNIGAQDLANGTDLTATADDPTAKVPLILSAATLGSFAEAPFASDTTPFVVAVDDGSSGPNDATSGTATVYLAVIHAPA